jgi:nicotinate-nucleotide pyrophosphorylase (carboxylating)
MVREVLMNTSHPVALTHQHDPGSITEAVRAAKKVGGFSVKIEVEARSEEEAEEAAHAGADVIMLDNFDGEGFKVAAKALKTKWTSSGHRHILIEASGGITEESISTYLSPGMMPCCVETGSAILTRRC